MPPEHMSLRLELFLQDMDQAIAFYTQILGFHVLRREAAYASLRNGLTFIQCQYQCRDELKMRPG